MLGEIVALDTVSGGDDGATNEGATQIRLVAIVAPASAHGALHADDEGPQVPHFLLNIAHQKTLRRDRRKVQTLGRRKTHVHSMT
ncbi:hypothetical protein [Sinorhizobium medicae]|uniref:hypothetical protein n=1 Tax=Sinorhizobium medicae TaxID=110321 RepID=UPI001F15E779|nr:hypothetical protein [Sinorhizobium medicae]